MNDKFVPPSQLLYSLTVVRQSLDTPELQNQKYVINPRGKLITFHVLHARSETVWKYIIR